MAGWKSSWNSLAVRLMLSFTAVRRHVTAVFSISPYIFVRRRRWRARWRPGGVSS